MQKCWIGLREGSIWKDSTLPLSWKALLLNIWGSVSHNVLHSKRVPRNVNAVLWKEAPALWKLDEYWTGKLKQVSSEQGFYVSLFGNATLAAEGSMRAIKCIEPWNVTLFYWELHGPDLYRSNHGDISENYYSFQMCVFPHTYLYMNFHSTWLISVQKIGTIQMSILQWINTQRSGINVHGTLLHSSKERSFDTTVLKTWQMERKKTVRGHLYGTAEGILLWTQEVS